MARAFGTQEQRSAAISSEWLRRRSPSLAMSSRRNSSTGLPLAAARCRNRDETPVSCDEMRDVMPGGRSPDGRKLRVRLIDASHGNIDPLSAISPIRALVITDARRRASDGTPPKSNPSGKKRFRTEPATRS